MTKKDYIIIGNAIKKVLPNENWLNKMNQHKRIIVSISEALQEDNPNFNADRFAVACGLSQSQKIRCAYCTNYPCNEHARE